MLIAFLPKEKILFNADLYSPPAQGAQPTAPTPFVPDAAAEHPEMEAGRRPARPRPSGAWRPRRSS
jgi:hypothetical protein